MCVSADNAGKTRTRGKILRRRTLDGNKDYRAICKQIVAILEEEIESGIRRGYYYIDFLIRILLAQVIVQQFVLLLAGEPRGVEILTEELHLARRICEKTSLKAFVKTDIADEVFALPVKNEHLFRGILSARNRRQQRYQNE